MILIAFRQVLAAAFCLVVVSSELVVGPWPCEPVVRGAEIGHRSVREHDVKAAAPSASGRSFRCEGRGRPRAIPTRESWPYG